MFIHSVAGHTNLIFNFRKFYDLYKYNIYIYWNIIQYSYYLMKTDPVLLKDLICGSKTQFGHFSCNALALIKAMNVLVTLSTPTYYIYYLINP